MNNETLFAKRLVTDRAKQEPVGFEAREIGEGDGWFKVELDEPERIAVYIADPRMDYRWLYAAPIPTPEDVRDAELYRWIRDSDESGDVLYRLLTGELSGKEFDAEALAAMAAAPGEKK